MGAIAGILEFCNSFVNMIYLFGKWFLEGAVEVGELCIYWLFDGFYTLVSSLLSTLNFGNLLVDLTAGFDILPSQVVYVIDQVGLGTALTMICSALVVRVCLNIIPSIITRI